MGLKRKTSLRRHQVRKGISATRMSQISRWLDADVIISLCLWFTFVILCILLLLFEEIFHGEYHAMIPASVIIVLICIGLGCYTANFYPRLVKNHTRAVILEVLTLALFGVARIGMFSVHGSIWATSWATGTAVMMGLILAIAYEQRFAIGMGLFYCLLMCLGVHPSVHTPYQITDLGLLYTMIAGIMACSYSVKEIRTRMKLIEVGLVAAVVVFLCALFVNVIRPIDPPLLLSRALPVAGIHSLFAFLAVMIVHSFLPVIESVFRVATSMTLLGLSDANQSLLKRLAMEAPGTYSHSLMIGSIAEAAAEAIGCNGLLCRVGSYYHDIGKINKPKYFIENEMGSASRHKELSPAMSQLIIVGHVKDGIEMGKEYKLPAVIRQFIESHHGTTLVEPFYHEAKKQHGSPDKDGKSKAAPPPSESEFRYVGPKPHTKESAIVMLADAIEGAVRSLTEVTPPKIETVVHNIIMRRLQDGQFDECDITLRELKRVESAMCKVLAAHYHSRIAYPTAADESPEEKNSKGS